MSPLPPSGDVIVTNGGFITPYVRAEISEYQTRAFASLSADDNINYIDIYGLEDVSEWQYEWPPTSNIEDIERLENGVVRVTSSEPWTPAPFELNFELQKPSGAVIDFYITFE